MQAAADAYARRATEYTDKLGSMAVVDPADRLLVDTWATQTQGPVLDAGCGPGHWTHHLSSHGLNAHGIDLTPDFIDHARGAYPRAHFDVADIDHIPYPDHTFALVLSWYSTIHHSPDTIHRPLTEFARVLAPGGVLILGHFAGSSVQAFDHAVTPAYQWPTTELAAVAEQIGLTVIETHQRTAPGHRPHGAIVARLDDHEAPAPAC